MTRKIPKLKKLETPAKGGMAETLRGLPRPKLSRPFGHKAAMAKDSGIAYRLEQLLGLSQKEKKESGMRLARAALSTLNLLIGEEQIRVSKNRATRSLSRANSSPSATTSWMLKTFLAFLRAAGPETMITRVAFHQPKRKTHDGREDLHPLFGAKKSLEGEHTVIYSSSEFYRRDGVTRLYK